MCYPGEYFKFLTIERASKRQQDAKYGVLPMYSLVVSFDRFPRILFSLLPVVRYKDAGKRYGILTLPSRAIQQDSVQYRGTVLCKTSWFRHEPFPVEPRFDPAVQQQYNSAMA